MSAALVRHQASLRTSRWLRRLVMLLTWMIPATSLAVDVDVGGGAGISRLGGTLYSAVDVAARLREGPLDVAVRLPLRAQITRPNALRERDWDDRGELLRLVPMLAYSRDVAPGRLARVSLRIAPTAGATLGHGSMIRDYRSALLPDRYKSGVRLNVDGDALGLQLVADDVSRFELLGIRLFARPLSQGRTGVAPQRRSALQNLTIAISAAADRRAPIALQRDAAQTLRFDAAGRPISTRAPLVLVGVDVGLPIALGRFQHLVPYLDANLASVDVGSGAGLHAGLWWSWRGAAAKVRVRWEARRSEGSYRPGWIDGFYALERTQLGRSGQTKAGAWLDRGAGGRWGHLLEARASSPAGWRLAATWETWHRGLDDRPADTASVRISTPVWRGAQAHGAWALRPGPGQQSVAMAARWQGQGPWHAWINVARTWHADAGIYDLQFNAGAGVGMRWAW